MGIFRKKIKFVAAICPECDGRLQLTSNMEVAYCPKCGAQCIVEDVPNKKKGKLETILGFVERQQEIKRKEKEDKLKRKAEEKIKQEEQAKKSRWIALGLLVVFMAFVIIMAVVEN